MRKIRACLLALTLLTGVAASAPPAAAIEPTTRGLAVRRVDVSFDQQVYRRRVALCVGINRHGSYPALGYAKSDAEAMAALFRGYGFDEGVTILDREATKRKIVDEVLRLKVEREPDDLFVLFFAGHGRAVPREDGGEEGFLIPIDCEAGKEREQGISMGLFKDFADAMQNLRVLFLVDSCYSGLGLTRAARGLSVEPVETKNEALGYISAILPKRSLAMGCHEMADYAEAEPRHMAQDNLREIRTKLRQKRPSTVAPGKERERM